MSAAPTPNPPSAPVNASLSRQLAELGLAIDAGTLSKPATDAAKKLTLDAVACALAGRVAPGLAALQQHANTLGGAPQARLLTDGSRCPMPTAAMVNAVLIHAWDYDDVLPGGILHISSVVLPAVLAAAEHRAASGANALAALTAGVEVAGRIGLACKGRNRGPGFLPTTLCGGFGAVVAASRLLGLDAKQTTDAMGIQYAQVSGNRQALLDHSLTKRLQPGLASRSGIEAAMLAQCGVTGPREVFEGSAGFFRLYMNGEIPEADELLAPADTWQIERVALKRYPSCGACHHVQIAAERLRAQHSLQPEQIDRVSLFQCDPAGIVTGPFDPGEHPSVAAQFSAEWAVAHTLLRGPASLPDYTDDAVAADAEVIRLANAIRKAEPPPDVTLSEPGSQGVIVHTTDGRRLVAMQPRSATFTPEALSEADVEAKLRQCAAFAGHHTPDQVESILAAVRTLDQAPDLQPLLDRMTQPSN